MEWRLTEKDLEKLREIRRCINEGTACIYDKQKCLQYLETITEPKCAVCRKPLSVDFIIVNQHKMHEACRKRYKR